MPFLRFLTLPCLALIAFAAPLFASEPGLTTTFTAGNQTDARVDRMLALYVPAGQPVTPFLKAGPFTAKWEGQIESSIRGSFTFSAETSGKFKCTINGQVAWDGSGPKTIQINQGANQISAEFTSAAQGDSFVRFFWQSKDFPLEPVPPMAFAHTPTPAGQAGQQLRDGRLLFAQLNCAACHADAAKIPAKGQGMPELGQLAPLLSGFSTKYNPDFLTEWIADPHAIRPGTHMPKVFTGPDAAQKAADIAAALTQGEAPKPGAKPKAEDGLVGGALFANLGCIGCHQRPDAEVDGSPSPRMPHFRLNDEESTQLASYLLLNGRMIKRKAIQGDATRGGQLLLSAGCLNCHAGMPATTQPALAIVQKAADKGCLASTPAHRGTAPDYALTAPQRAALSAFLRTDLASLHQDVPAEFAARQIKDLNCVACHDRDSAGSTWAMVDNESRKLRAALPAKDHVEGEPVPDAPVPALTWTGEKLRNDWLVKFLAGKVEEKPRPWLIGRMPGFAHFADGLALGFAHQHGLPQQEPAEPAPNETKVKFGETLLGNSGGFNCIQCHGLGDQAATAVFEAPAINFVQSNERLRKGYFARWVMAPTRIDPQTKMPKYADPEGMTQLTDPLDGKGAEQFEAIREYLRTVK
ncbi:MAG: c-type cytochrome [Verrucomicrobiae bacterium]|nr:c-type cytochrome [Verrucomicrobiae bacterium]